MGRRNDLKGVATGLVDKFNSRNNDLNGYWGIGKLCELTESQNISSVRLELLINVIEPKNNAFAEMMDTFTLWLENQLHKQAIPTEWVTKVIITVHFDQEYDRRYHWPRVTGGSPYICTCQIIDDHGRVRTANSGGYCWPHTEKREQRRQQPS